MNRFEVVDMKKADIQAGDRVGVYLDVIRTSGGLRVSVAGHDYDFSRFQIADHLPTIKVGDKVHHATFTDEEAHVAAFLQKDGTICPPNVWSPTALCSTQHGPRIITTEELRRL